MPKLIILSDAETPVELVSVRLPDIDPLTALPAILEAITALPKPRKQRSDAGKSRQPQEAQ